MKKFLMPSFLIVLAAAGTIVGQPSAPGAGESLSRQLDSEIREFGSSERKNALANAGERINKGFGTYKTAKELYEAAEALSKGDCAPDFSVNPQAAVPSSCAETPKGTAAGPEPTRNSEPDNCATCFEGAYKKLSDVRKRLAKLKCLGNATKTYVNAAVAFGDNVSSVHAIQGLAWQRERKNIMDSYTKFKAAYDAKYKELMTVLLDAMNNISECEAKIGNADWFQRYGFMYVEFMAEKYKRVD